MEDSRSLIGKSFLRNAYFGYGAKGFKIALGFAWVTILTAVAGVNIYGKVALLTSLAGLVGNLLAFRTNEAVVKFYKRGILENDDGLCKLALVAGFALDTIVALALFTIIRTFADDIATSLLKDLDSKAAVTAFSWVVLARFLRGTGIGFLIAKERFRVMYSLTVAEDFLRLFLLLLGLYMGLAVKLDTIVWMIALPALLTSVIIVVVPVGKLYLLPRHARIRLTNLRGFLSFTASTFTSSALKAGNRGIDVIILGLLTNPDNVGIYSLFQRFLSPLSTVVGPFHAQIYPRFVQAIAEGESDRIWYTVDSANKKIGKWSLLLLLIVSAATALYWFFMQLPFSVVNLSTFTMVATTTLLFQRLWWTRGFALAHDPAISIRGNLIQSLLTVSLVYLFAANYGVVGAALGMLCTAVGVSVYFHYVLSNYSRKVESE